MRKLDPKSLSYLGYAIWPAYLLWNFWSMIDFRDFLRAEFWLDAGGVLLITLGVFAAIGGCVYADYRFCGWFDRTIEGKRSSLRERIALRSGEVAWPASDPLHDPELDRSVPFQVATSRSSRYLIYGRLVDIVLIARNEIRGRRSIPWGRF